MYIDDENNIEFKIDISLNNIINKILLDENIDIRIGEKSFSIPLYELKMKKNQEYILKNQGIIKQYEYDTVLLENKSNISIAITLI